MFTIPLAALSVTAGLLTAAPVTGLARFHHQTITWHACQDGPDDRIGKLLDTAGGRCGGVKVPLDYSRPDGRTITVAVSRIKATDPARRRGVLFTNGGGPGGPGLGQPLNFGDVPDIGKHYDVIGMDPRFVARSAPLRCDWPTDTFLWSAGPDRRTFRRGVAFARRLATGCTKGNEHLLPYATTRNTARDMDVIRAVLGEPKISYESGSYGSYLGAVYLQMFGKRADRFVLDSSLDPDVYGPDALARNGPAAAAALADWAKWAAGHHATYGLGATAADVLATVDRISRAAERRPLRVGTFRVDTRTLPYIMLLQVAEDDEAYRAAATGVVRTLRDAANGVGVTPSPMFKELLTGLLTGSGVAADRAGLPILCADRAASHDPGSYFRDIQAHRAGEPLFGPLIHNITPCAFWPIRPVEPPTTIRNDIPVLMVANAGDPITPHSGQLAMHRALGGSRLLTVPGAYRHQAYLNGSACVDDAVKRYLVDGVLPAADATCR